MTINIESEIRAEFRGKVRTDFMVGIEIEKTPAYSKKTLLVQGFKSFEEIYKKAIENDVQHVYLGANRSFIPGHDWASLIVKLLDCNLMVTLDYLTAHHKELTTALPKSIWDNENFIPMVTVDIINLTGLSKNLTVKIDDLDFVSKGIWCINQHELADPSKFTAWDEYAEDKIV